MSSCTCERCTYARHKAREDAFSGRPNSNPYASNSLFDTLGNAIFGNPNEAPSRAYDVTYQRAKDGK